MKTKKGDQSNGTVAQPESIYSATSVHTTFGLSNASATLIDPSMPARSMKSKDVGGEGIRHSTHTDDSDGIISVYSETEDESESEPEWEIFEAEMMALS